MNVWTLNDDEHGTCLSACQQLEMCLLRAVDGRILHHLGAMRQALVEHLRRDQPELLFGILKSPATEIGSRHERYTADTLAALFREQVSWNGRILLCSPDTTRLWSQPGIRTLLHDFKLRLFPQNGVASEYPISKIDSFASIT